MTPNDKIILFKDTPQFLALRPREQDFIIQKSKQFHLSYQMIKQLIDIASDIEMWEEGELSDIWQNHDDSKTTGKNRVSLIMGSLIHQWERLKTQNKNYASFQPEVPELPEIHFVMEKGESTLLGKCPVASDRTRCCNLQTLDAVKGCGFACSYCSIQSFYTEGNIVFQENFTEKLQHLQINSDNIYHIGTGQSSDSLMWGNKEGLLDSLFTFAWKYPNVILELKTKSDNISYLLNNKIPPNVLVTWSLNTDTIIKAEEHLTASLQNRLKAAREIADRGALIGFHFHPMVFYKEWKKEYTNIFLQVQNIFSADEVALISLGTLTFIKPVIRQLRRHKIKSKILQMPLADASGKLSYPLAIKRQMFKAAYDSFSSEWKEKVFFYLCMEDPTLWQDVFGYEYSSNDEFEEAMKTSYLKKIKRLRAAITAESGNVHA